MSRIIQIMTPPRDMWAFFRSEAGISAEKVDLLALRDDGAVTALFFINGLSEFVDVNELKGFFMGLRFTHKWEPP